MFKRLTLVALLLLVLSACKPSAPTPSETPAAVAVENSPVPPTNTPSPVPATATAIPPTATPAPTATPEPQAYGPDNFPQNVNPLTGLLVSDPTLLNRRPLAVKVQIIPRGQRPPWGVSLADIVFDYYQNNGSTRFNAIFYGNDAEKVGPIRSARLLDAKIVRMYKAIFAFGGADQRILNTLYSSDFADRLVVEGSHDCPPMCREDPNGYNFLLTNTDELGKYAASNGVTNNRQDLNGMSFDPKLPDGGETGKQVFVRFNYSDYNRWDYDAASGSYLRFQDTQNDENGAGEAYTPLLDRLTEKQIAADNVVILFVPHTFVLKTRGTEIVDIQLYDSGPAYAFRDGQAYQVNWNRPTLDSVISLTFPDGTPYPFKPGNTWFQVVGQTSKYEKPADSVWRFTFSIP